MGGGRGLSRAGGAVGPTTFRRTWPSFSFSLPSPPPRPSFLLAHKHFRRPAEASRRALLWARRRECNWGGRDGGGCGCGGGSGGGRGGGLAGGWGTHGRRLGLRGRRWGPQPRPPPSLVRRLRRTRLSASRRSPWPTLTRQCRRAVRRAYGWRRSSERRQRRGRRPAPTPHI